MKQKIYIAALLAGMLALAGCGGGSSAGPGSGSNGDTGTTQQELNAEVAKLTTELAKDSPDSDMVTTLRKAVDDLLKGNLADGVTTADANQAIGAADRVIANATKAANASSMASAEKLVAAFADEDIFPNDSPYGSIRSETQVDVFTTGGKAGTDSPGGWNVVAYEDTANGVKTEAHVYTNEGDPKQVDLDGLTGGDRLGFIDPSDADDPVTVPNSVLTTDDNRPRIVSSEFTSRSGTTDHTELDAFTAGRVQYSGTYAGVSGHYVCSTGCTVTVNGDGEIVALTGWTFQATAKEADIKVAMDDADYLYFGWWKQTTTSTGVIPMAGVFVGEKGSAFDAPIENGVSNVNLAASATYTGDAVGLYSWDDKVRETAHAGNFTAKAVLEADFDDDKITGTINGFRLNGGTTDPGWSVSLHFNDDDDDDPEPVTTWKSGSVEDKETGVWAYSMYDEKADASNTPTTVIGQFRSQFHDTGNMVGAFGATN